MRPQTLAIGALTFGLAVSTAVLLLHDGYREAARRVIGISTIKTASPDRTLELARVTRENLELRKGFEQLRLSTTSLVVATNVLVLAHHGLEARHAVVKTKLDRQIRTAGRIGESVATRVARGTARQAGTLIPRSLPGLGVAANVSLLGLDIADACLTLKEINEMNIELGLSAADVDTTCGIHVPSVEQIREEVRARAARIQVKTER